MSDDDDIKRYGEAMPPEVRQFIPEEPTQLSEEDMALGRKILESLENMTPEQRAAERAEFLLWDRACAGDGLEDFDVSIGSNPMTMAEQMAMIATSKEAQATLARLQALPQPATTQQLYDAVHATHRACDCCRLYTDGACRCPR